MVKIFGALCLFFAVFLKVHFFNFDIFNFEESKNYYQKKIFEKVFILPSINTMKYLSLDRKLFASRVLDYINIANREFLVRSGEWKNITQTSLALNPKSLNTLIIVAYQYMAGKTPNDFSNFLFIDKLIRKKIDIAKKDWQLMMVMGYWWQFRLHSLRGAEIYAKALYENKEASISIRETYPIVLSKLNEKQKAILFYEVLLKHTKKKEERKWLQEQIKKLKSK